MHGLDKPGVFTTVSMALCQQMGESPQRCAVLSVLSVFHHTRAEYQAGYRSGFRRGYREGFGAN